MPRSPCGQGISLTDANSFVQVGSGRGNLPAPYHAKYVTIAFVIKRLSHYRMLGPVIDRALEKGWNVECWHDYGGSADGAKAYLFPSVDGLPRFRHGYPTIETYDETPELVRRLERGDVQATVAIDVPPLMVARRVSSARQPPWACVQVSADTFALNQLDALERCDLLCQHTSWWTTWAASYYAAKEGRADGSAFASRLACFTTCVGSPEIDARRIVDGDDVRRRWGIPRNQPVVVLLPFPRGVGKSSFWPKKIFAEPSRARRLMNVAMYRQFKYWRRAIADTTDADVVRAIRAFCDRNGAFLLVKSRRKTPVSAYTRAVADLCVYDESYYPPTILEALSIASLCISFYSLGAVEAAAMSVPNLCVTFSAEDYLGHHRDEYVSFERLYTRTRGSLFEFPGVSRTVTPDEAIAELGTRALSEFEVDASARAAYVRQFIGEDDGRASVRLLEAIERSVASPAAVVPAVEPS